MPRRLLVHTPTAVALFVLLAGPAWAATPPAAGPRYWFLHNLQPADLDRTDWLLLRQNVTLALYELADDQSVGWTHLGTDHQGAVRVLTTYAIAGRTCRQVRVSIDVDQGSDFGVYGLCESPGGFWVFAHTPRPPVRVDTGIQPAGAPREASSR